MAPIPGQRFLVGAGLWLLILGVATPQVLSALTDNVYLWLIVLALLAPVGVLFLAAAAAPLTPRLWLWRAGLWLLWIVGAVATPLLGLGLGIILFQGSAGVAPIASYGLGLTGLMATLYVVTFRH